MVSARGFINLCLIFHRVSKYANQRFPHIPIERISHKNQSLSPQQFQHMTPIQSEPNQNQTKELIMERSVSVEKYNNYYQNNAGKCRIKRESRKLNLMDTELLNSIEGKYLKTEKGGNDSVPYLGKSHPFGFHLSFI